jgi:adenosylcobinamide-phosphate synthase
MVEPIALTALVLDAAIGWPRWLYRLIGHPVGLFARVIEGCERAWNRPTQPFWIRRLLGLLAMVLLIAMVGVTAATIQAWLAHLFGQLGWAAVAVLAFPALAQRSLYDHVRSVRSALCDENLLAARHAVSMVVGRDTEQLDEAGISRAAIESLAESFCDGVAAPLFWLLIFGLPGVWIYKAINTADSLIGHREERWRAYGWAAARLDDVLNLVPARLAGSVICIVAPGGWKTMWRDAAHHASPNAGWTEAAMAGALNLRLAGAVTYDGVRQAKAWIGNGSSLATADDIDRALNVYLRACLFLWLLAGSAAWIF